MCDGRCAGRAGGEEIVCGVRGGADGLGWSEGEEGPVGLERGGVWDGWGGSG